jgi:hypothetical protein
MAIGTQDQGYLLAPIQDCYIRVGTYYILMYTLPDIQDSHTSSFAEENGIGRSMPIKIFGQGGNREITWKATFVADSEYATARNLYYLRLLQACTYPREDNTMGFPYTPPPLVYLRCGRLLSDKGSPVNPSGELCTVLKSCSVAWPKDVPWQDVSLIPYKFDVSLSFDVVYSTVDMPGSERIFQWGG